MMLTTRLHPMPKLRMMELYFHFPIHLRNIVLRYVIKYRDNYLSPLRTLARREYGTSCKSLTSSSSAFMEFGNPDFLHRPLRS
jgi:hypothetical protein